MLWIHLFKVNLQKTNGPAVKRRLCSLLLLLPPLAWGQESTIIFRDDQRFHLSQISEFERGWATDLWRIEISSACL